MKLPVALYVDDDGWFVVSCLAIPGCASQCRAEEEARANIREAIQIGLEVRKEDGPPLTIETREVEVPAVAWTPSRFRSRGHSGAVAPTAVRN